MSTQIIRQQLLTKRRQLSAKDVAVFSHKITKQLWDLDSIQQAQHIAVYHAMRDEVNLYSFVQQAWSQHKQCYLPCVNSQQKNLSFKAYLPNSNLQKNYLHIPEPQTQQTIAIKTLDIILVPLVGFDTQLNRLGMGGGYYDRAFAYLLKESRPTKPLLIGVAFACQQTPSLNNKPWDVPMDYIVTESNIFIQKEKS